MSKQVAKLERRHKIGYLMRPASAEEFGVSSRFVQPRKKGGAYEEGILRNVITVLKNELDPKQIIIFGSRAKGTFHPGSDFDIAIDRKSPNENIKRKIEEAIEEVRGLHGVDVIYLKDGDPLFRKVVFETGKTIYEKRNKKSSV